MKRWANFWSDFNSENEWRFPDVAPWRLQGLLGWPILDQAEHIRAEWMWRRRPRLLLGEGIFGYCLVIGVGIALLFVPGTGILLDLVWLLINSLFIASDTVRLNRWRRDYEASLDRLIRTMQYRKTT